MKLVYGLPTELPTVRTEIQLEISLLDEYVGTYELSPAFSLAFSLVVTRVGDQLITQATGQGKLPIFAEAKDLFFPKLVPATITFTRDDGKVTGLILKQNGREMKAKRL